MNSIHFHPQITATTFNSNTKKNLQKPDVLNDAGLQFAKPSLEHLKANFISFGKQKETSQYDSDYANKDNYNGKTPEKYLFNVLNKYFPNKPHHEIQVLDIGAGDGRNTIPLAMKNYKMTAIEFSEQGRIKIANKATDLNLSDSVKVLDADVLEKDQLKQIDTKQDFTFMSRVSQHFSEEELKTSLKNLHDLTKLGGIIAFDALIQQPGYQAGAFDPENMQNRGIANHNLLNLMANAQELGLEVLSISDYEFPSTDELAEYLIKENPGWGRAKNDKRNQRVKLQLFILKKPENVNNNKP